MRFRTSFRTPDNLLKATASGITMSPMIRMYSVAACADSSLKNLAKRFLQESSALEPRAYIAFWIVLSTLLIAGCIIKIK